MNIRWSFFTFDWGRFRTLEPVFLRAWETGDLPNTGLPEAEEALDSLDEDASLEEACNALLVALCGTGEAVVFEGGLPDMVRRLRRMPEGEETAEWLGYLISASPGMEAWFDSGSGLAGILTAEQTRSLADAFTSFRAVYRPPEPPRGLSAWSRRLHPVEPALERLEDLMNLVAGTAARHMGLAVHTEG